MSAATGALGPVLGKLAALLQAEYMRLRSIHNEIHNLTDELKAIDAFLKDMADVEDPTEQDKVWVQWVRDLSYDIEDNLDDFMARVVADKSAKPDGFMDKIKSPLKRIKARREIAKAIEDLKKKVIEVSERNKRYRDHAVPNTSNASLKVDPRAHTIFKDASELVGVDGPKRELIQLLADSDSTKHQPALVSVVGFGGLGKTTIANQVYQELKGQFDCHVLFSVSRNPDITRVMSNMYGQLNKEYSPGNEDLQTLIRKILDFLEDKRYLLKIFLALHLNMHTFCHSLLPAWRLSRKCERPILTVWNVYAKYIYDF